MGHPLHAEGSPVRRWIWVSLSYATFGIAVEDGVVTEAPPIAHWAVGRDERGVADFYRRRGAKLTPLDPRESDGPVREAPPRG